LEGEEGEEGEEANDQKRHQILRIITLEIRR